LSARVSLRRLADTKMTVFVRAFVCAWGAFSGSTFLRICLNWDVLKQQNKPVQSSLNHYITFF
jgi:hypothetical protein